MAEVVLTEGHNGGTVQARVGDTITIALPENPTTGFRWTVSAADAVLLAPTGNDFQLTGSGTGGGGVRTFRFLAKGQGNADLELRLARSWDTGAPRDVFHARVRVSTH
jgi:inhibitor of cysteine peptidase